ASALSGEPGVAAEATFVRGQIEYERTSPAADAALSLEAATLIAPTAPERAVSMLTEAVWAARDAGAHDLIRQSVRLLETVRLPAGSVLAPVAEALVGYGSLVDGQVAAAIGPLRTLVTAAVEGA